MISARISEVIYDRVMTDLRRQHPFAAERVGFLSVKQTVVNDTVLLFAREYFSIPDDYYVCDYTVGARIGGDAIRFAMQQVLDTRRGMFHLHLHEHVGRTNFSGTDKFELRKLIPSFQRVGRELCHGALVFSEDDCRCLVLPPYATSFVAARVSIITAPIAIYE